MLDLTTGDKLKDRYELLERLSNSETGGVQAGMSIVWAATDSHCSGVPVIIKFLPHNRIKDKQSQERFRREQSILFQLRSHPCIVSLLDRGDYHGPKDDKDGTVYPYLVFERLDGDLISIERAPLTPDRLQFLLRSFIDAAAGVMAAHKKDLWHRDLKPENLLYCTIGSRTKVADFGLAKPHDAPVSGFPGTRPYMAPELLRGEKEPDWKRCDIYSLGVTMHHLLTGKLPWRINAAYDDVARRQPPKLRDGNDSNGLISPHLEELVYRMISYEPMKRPEEVGVVFEELEDELAIHRGFVRPPDAVLNRIPVLKQICEACETKCARGIKRLAATDSCVWPFSNEEDDWYATVLFRATHQRERCDQSPCKVLYPVYFAHYVGKRLTHSANWTKQPELRTHAHPVDKCCSGLPIRWYDECLEWREKGLLNRRFIRVEIDNRSDRVLYIVCRNVYLARYGDNVADTNLIRCSYASDAKQEWGTKIPWTFRSDKGEEHEMRKDIQTEIVFPIYGRPVSSRGKAVDILAVANFEWVAQFNADRERQICEYLSREIHDNSVLSATPFTTQVMGAMTSYGDRAAVQHP